MSKTGSHIGINFMALSFEKGCNVMICQVLVSAQRKNDPKFGAKMSVHVAFKITIGKPVVICIGKCGPV